MAKKKTETKKQAAAEADSVSSDEQMVNGQTGEEQEVTPADTGSQESLRWEAGEEAQEKKEAGKGTQGEESGDSEQEALRAEIEKLKAENSDLKNQYLRKQADFENFRKRMTREKQEAIRYSNKDLILDLVAIIDDFERAIKSAEDSKDFESFKEGISLIEKQFTGMLEKKWGLLRIDAEGEEFDPQKHEAMMMEESEDHEHPVVLEDYQTGYMLDDRVIRPSKVKVARPADG